MTAEETDRGAVTRRRLLRAGGIVSLASLTGCSGVFGSDDATPTATSVSPEPNGDTGTISGIGVATEADTEQTVTADEQRVEETLSSLSLSEKIGQMTLLEPKGGGNVFSADRAKQVVSEWQVGGVLFGGANAPGTSAEDAASYFNAVQSAAVGDVGVPALVGLDAVHGNATVKQAAVFPHQVGLGATWNTDVAYEVGARTARSLAAIGVNWTYSPVADVAYDPRWGRYYEAFNEDPTVTGAFVDAMVSGYERVVDGDKQVGASVKHYAGYSSPETGDDREPVDVSARTLQDLVLPPFRDGVDAGAETVMANSGSVNGVPAHASEWLLTAVLREQWGFDGLVVSDWADIHRLLSMHEYTSGFREAVAVVINAGVDMYMAPHVRQIQQFQPVLESLVEEGTVSEDRIDEAVRRVLRVKDRLGLFESATVPVANHTDSVRQADRGLARRAAEQSLTLLTNDDVLPIGSDLSVLVTGPNADSVRRQLGGWTTAWQGVSDPGAAPETTTVREGVEAVAPDGVDVTYVETAPEELANRSAVADAANDADVAVAVVGEGPYAEGQGDVDDLALPQGQRDLVATLDESSAATVGVVVAGRPRGSPDLFDRFDASLMAYYPGSEGGAAIARALFGAVAPAGRLPFTWPRSAGQIPDVLPHRSPTGVSGQGADGPLFAFGTGGTYAPVVHEDVSLSTGSVTGVSDADGLTARVTLQNDGDRPTDECVVVYADYDNTADISDSPVIPPVKRVVGFGRTRLDAGSAKTVDVPLDVTALAVTDGGVTGDGDRVVPAGRYEIGTGSESTTLAVESTSPL